MMTPLWCPHCHAELEVKVRLKAIIPGHVLQESVNNLPLSGRAYNVLRRASIGTVGELAQKSEYDMRRTKGCGKKVLAELKDILIVKGLQLRKAPEDVI